MRMILGLLVILNCMACKGQNKVNAEKSVPVAVEKQLPVSSSDTLTAIKLQGKQYGSHIYRVLHLSNMEKDEKNIVVTIDGKPSAVIPLPKADDEVKNFSITGISETEKGFKVSVDWGGGQYFYSREFYFSFKGNYFFLDLIRSSSFTEGSEKKKWSVKTIKPPVAINSFKLVSYLENE